MQDGWKSVWNIPYVSVAFFPSLKRNFIAYRSSKVSNCIFEIHQLRQSGFYRVYSNSCCSCSFEPEIIKIGQSSHKMYSNNMLDFNFKCPFEKSLETYRMPFVTHSWEDKGVHTFPQEYLSESERNSVTRVWTRSIRLPQTGALTFTPWGSVFAVYLFVSCFFLKNFSLRLFKLFSPWRFISC